MSFVGFPGQAVVEQQVGELCGVVHTSVRTPCRMPAGSLIWMGPPCQSWVWMARHVFGRSSTDATGDVSNPSAVMSNKIAKFVAKAIVAATARQVFVVVEQPLSSVLFEYCDAQDAIESVVGQFVTVILGTSVHHP